MNNHFPNTMEHTSTSISLLTLNLSVRFKNLSVRFKRVLLFCIELCLSQSREGGEGRHSEKLQSVCLPSVHLATSTHTLTHSLTLLTHSHKHMRYSQRDNFSVFLLQCNLQRISAFLIFLAQLHSPLDE